MGKTYRKSEYRKPSTTHLQAVNLQPVKKHEKYYSYNPASGSSPNIQVVLEKQRQRALKRLNSQK